MYILYSEKEREREDKQKVKMLAIDKSGYSCSFTVSFQIKSYS